MIARRTLLAIASLLPLAARAGVVAPDLRAIERRRVLPLARALLAEQPRTIVATPAPRSPAGPHDYYSEGDYWWPDPAKPGGPYIRRDGRSNPDKFDGHRDALIRFGRIVPMLAVAWDLTGETRYAAAAIRHLRAWFVDPTSAMNPNLQHAQAIIGVNTGRAIGVIDTLQIVEVARAASLFARRNAPGYAAIRKGVEAWFSRYLDWLTTSSFGIEERDQANNHGTCWLLQAAAFASVVGREDVLAAARERLRNVIIPAQIAPDGRQPLELARTKPYAYCLFNLDVLAASAWLLSKGKGELIGWRTPDGRSIGQAIAFMAPYIADKGKWPFARDIEYFDGFPVRHPALLLGAQALDRPDWQRIWSGLNPDPAIGEVIRNFPVRQPLLWADSSGSAR